MDSKLDSEATLARLSSLLRQQSTNGVVFVGDITDTGDKSAWLRVSLVVVEYCRSISYAFGLFAVPGNHDVYFVGHNEFLPKHDSFTKAELSKLMWNVDFHKKRRVVARVKESNIILVLLDSNGRENSNPITNAIGHVAEYQMSKALRELKKIRNENDVVIVVVHHHLLLVKGGPKEWFLRCLNAQKVLDFADDIRASAIVTGHRHDPFVTSYGERNMLYISCGSLHHPEQTPGSTHGDRRPSAVLLSIGPKVISAEVLPL